MEWGLVSWMKIVSHLKNIVIDYFFSFTGSFLSGLFRTVVPIVKKGSIALGQELLKTGVGAAEDIWKTGDLKYTQKKRGKEFINNVSNRLADHMFGSGYTPNLITTLSQSKRSTRRRKSGKVIKRKTKKRKTIKKKKGGRKATKKNKTVKKKKNRRTKQDILDIFS